MSFPDGIDLKTLRRLDRWYFGGWSVFLVVMTILGVIAVAGR